MYPQLQPTSSIRPQQPTKPDPSSTSTSTSTTPTCANCSTQTTPLWRRDDSGATLCNACALFQKMKGRPRPISLKTDVIKQRNRVKAVDREPKSQTKSTQPVIGSKQPTINQAPLHSHPPNCTDREPTSEAVPNEPCARVTLEPHLPSSCSPSSAFSHRQPTRSRDPVRSSANARKSDPGGVPDHDPQDHIHENQSSGEGSHHAGRSKRRKDYSTTLSTDPSQPQRLLRRPKAALNSILLHAENPSGSLRTQSLAGFRSCSATTIMPSSSQHHHHPRSTSTRLGASLGSPRDFSFDLRSISLDHSNHHTITSDTTDVTPSSLGHGSIPSLRIPPPDSLSFSPIPSPLARSVSVDRNPVTKTALNLHPLHHTPISIHPRDDDRGRPRFREPLRLPPFSQLTAQVPFTAHEALTHPDSRFSSNTSTPYEQSPSRHTCGPPLSFEASAREATQMSPQTHNRPSALGTIHAASLLGHQIHELSNRACSVTSSASDNDSTHSVHLPWPEPRRFLAIHTDHAQPGFQPHTPPGTRRGRSEPRKGGGGPEEEFGSEEELVRLRHRVAELELLNGLMKSRIGQLEEDHVQQHSRACSTASSTRWVGPAGLEEPSSSSSSVAGAGTRMEIEGEDAEVDQLEAGELFSLAH